MKRFLCALAGCLCLLLPLMAQSNKLIKELESKRGALQKQIAESESLLQTTTKNVGSQLKGLAALTGQIEERKRYILAINSDMDAIDRELVSLERQLNQLQKELKDKKTKYAASVNYLYRNHTIQDKLLFIFSAQTLEQTYRRLRYVREYASYQRMQGEEILKKQKQINDKRAELTEARKAKENLLKERENEKITLERQEKEQKALVDSLRKKQRSLQSEINKKRKDEEEARREAAARKKAEKTESPSAAKPKAEPLEAYTMNKADRELSGSFASNRGKLPVPVTGPYIITSHYGEYTVPGLRGVKLDNKGIDIQAKPGAQARAVFNGKVAAVFQLNGLFNILVRHGAYISVYCNLSTASVKADDMVKTGQTLGTIFSDGADGGRTVLHFQLRREKEKLNPEPWLNR